MSFGLHRRVASSYPWIAGVTLLSVGMATLIRPEILAHYGITIDTAQARIAMRAIIGGGEIALAIILLIGGRFDLTLRQRSLVAAITFTTVGLIRLIAGLTESSEAFLGQSLREASIEIALGFVGFWAVRSHSKL